MTIIYKNSNVVLKKTKKKKEYELTTDWEKNTKAFWVNFPFPYLKIIDEKTDTDEKTQTKKYTIYSDSITILSEWIKKHKEDYAVAIQMIYDIGNQLQTLEGFNLAVPFLDTDDIIVVENEKSLHFLYINDDKVYSFDVENKIEINKLHKKSNYLPPELSSNNKLPIKLHYKSGIYSLACLVSHNLLSKQINEKNKNESLEIIFPTKLFWTLKRMLETEPSDRHYLII